MGKDHLGLGDSGNELGIFLVICWAIMRDTISKTASVSKELRSCEGFWAARNRCSTSYSTATCQPCDLAISWTNLWCVASAFARASPWWKRVRSSAVEAAPSQSTIEMDFSSFLSRGLADSPPRLLIINSSSPSAARVQAECVRAEYGTYLKERKASSTFDGMAKQYLLAARIRKQTRGNQQRKTGLNGSTSLEWCW